MDINKINNKILFSNKLTNLYVTQPMMTQCSGKKIIYMFIRFKNKIQ